MGPRVREDDIDSWALKPPQRHRLYLVVRALLEDQRCARAGRQNVVLEIGEVGAFPYRGCGSDRLFVGQRRITMEVGLRIVEGGVAQRQPAPHVPFAQHCLVGVDIDGEIEEIGNDGYRLAVTRQPSGLQHIDALDDQNVGLVDLLPLVRNDVPTQMRIDRRAHTPVYSHLSWDIVPNQWQEVDQPDILIVEGVNVLQTGRLPRDGKAVAVVSDFFDFSVYLDADETVLRDWYITRFLTLRDTAFH